MRYSLLILSVVMAGCSMQDYDPRSTTSTDPSVMPYYWRFQGDTGVSPFGMALSIVPLRVGELGRCTIYTGHDKDYREIRLNSNVWNTMSDMDKEQLIYHELGHCVLGRQHDDSTIDGYTPKTIMATNHFPEYRYVQYRKYYLLEFTNPYMTIGRAYASQ